MQGYLVSMNGMSSLFANSIASSVPTIRAVLCRSHLFLHEKEQTQNKVSLRYELSVAGCLRPRVYVQAHVCEFVRLRANKCEWTHSCA